MPKNTIHKVMKGWVADTWSDLEPQLEVKFPGHRADVVLRSVGVVVEVQVAAMSFEEWDRRNRDYNREGYAVLWLWNRKVPTWAEGYTLTPTGKLSAPGVILHPFFKSASALVGLRDTGAHVPYVPHYLEEWRALQIPCSGESALA